MREHTFDKFTRRAGQAVSRRGSLVTLSGVALALGLARPEFTEAKKGGKKNDKCKKQVSRCKAGLSDLCDSIFVSKARSGTQAEGAVFDCFTAFERCCEFLSECNAGHAFACAVDVVESFDEEE